MKPSVMISHSSLDAQAANALCRDLEAAGIPCWIAPRDISPGEDWGDEIVEGIKKCRTFLLLYTRNSCASEIVKDEIMQAKNRRKRIIAIRFDDSTIEGFMDFHLSRKHWISAHLVNEADRLPWAALETIKALQEAPTARRRAKVTAGGEPPVESSTKQAPLPVTFVNPYEFDTTATSRTFKGRQSELDELVDAVESGTHTAIFGLQRMGKTSLIEEGLRERLASDLPLAQSIILAKVDLQSLGGDEVTYRDLVHAMLESILSAMSAEGIVKPVGGLRNKTNELWATNRYERGDRSEFFQTFSRLLRLMGETAKRRIVMTIDEFSEVRKVIERNNRALINNPARTKNLLPHDMFLDVKFMHHLSSMLKDKTLKQHFTMVVCVRPFMSEYDDKHELQVLKLMKPITLYHLDADAAYALVTEPVRGRITYEPGVAEYLQQLTAGHPYLLQFMLKQLVDSLRRQKRELVSLADVQLIEERMVKEGPAYDAQFEVVISDYSIDEVTIPQEARLGKGALALIAKLGQMAPERWVLDDVIYDALAKQKIPREKTASLLSQLSRTKIVEETDVEGTLHYRISIPLLQKRFVRQNLYLKYFR